MQFGISELFTPAAVAMAVSGGMLLGVTVVFKTSLTGDVLGVSGESKGLLMQKPGALKRMTFIVGLVLAGIFMSLGYGGFETMPPLSSSSSHFLLCVRLLGGGILMGVGTSLQNGCTSGHGLTGLARLSPRSWMSVATFMGSAAITATLARTSSVFPPEPAASTQSWKVAAIFTAVASAVLLFSAMCLLKCSAISQSKKQVTAELLSGLTFGAGLVTSTMAKPSTIAAFLDLGSGAWDPSLMFVMASALVITFPFFLLLKHWQIQKPLLDDKFHFSNGQKVDRNLVVGAICFGVGWGLCGMCPGPMWVLLGARPSLEVLVLVVAVLLGQGAVVAWQMYQKKSGAAQCVIVSVEAGASCAMELGVEVPKVPGDVGLVGHISKEALKDLSSEYHGWLYLSQSTEDHYFQQDDVEAACMSEVVLLPSNPSKDMTTDDILAAIARLPRPLMIQCAQGNRASVALLLSLAKEGGMKRAAADQLATDLDLKAFTRCPKSKCGPVCEWALGQLEV